MVRRSGSGLQESLLQQISVIISIAGGHINSYLPLIFEIMRDYWSEVFINFLLYHIELQVIYLIADYPLYLHFFQAC